MSKFLLGGIAIAIVWGSTQAHAASSCVAEIPNDCQVVNTVYSTQSRDDIQALQIDCLKSDGSYETLIAKISIKMGWLGASRVLMPSRVVYKKAARDDASLTCD